MAAEGRFFYNACASRHGPEETPLLHRPLLVALAVALVPAIALVAHAETQFRDIPAGHWALRPAGVLADRGLMPGRTPIDFAGEAPLTRYELAHSLSELFNVPGPPSTFLVLSDMMPGHPSTQEVQRVIGYELLPMRKPGYFQGDLPATRKEIVTALDLLLRKNNITPPSRRNNVIFSDVKPNTELGQALDRLVNRFGLFDAKAFTPFYPNSSLPRYGMLAMLTRAMPYLNPTVAAALKPPTPPPASRAPGASPEPTPSASLAPGVSPAPTTAPAATGPNLLASRAGVFLEPLLSFSEDLPSDVGAIVPSEPKNYSGSVLGGGTIGGGLVGEYWSGPVGGLAQVSSFYLPLTVNDQPVDLLDTFIQLGGLYKVGGGPDWEAALGGAGMFRKTFNMTSAPPHNFYMDSDKTYFGAGPAVAFAVRTSPELVLSGTALLYPFIDEGYTLKTTPIGLSRWGADLSARGEYSLSPTLFLAGGVHAFLSGGYTSGFQSFLGATLGAGTRF
jgi:hypothetical protein